MLGQTISHYKILEKLGEGGMGVVYKAQDTKLDRFVALKFLPAHISESEQEKSRFIQEAKSASALNHPNVCTIYGIDEYEGPQGGKQQFIEMELVDGITLRDKISGSDRGKSSPLTIKQVVDYGIQIAEALQEAHSKGIIHRDVKSENIMVNSKNQIKVMDFGLAKLKGSLKLTRTSSTIGTLAYMSPEQIQGKEADIRSDIFSFGVVLFEMTTSKTPFRGEHEAAIMYSIVNEEPEDTMKYRQDVPTELLHILKKSLEKDPEDRYQSISEIIVDLRRLKKESTRVVRTSLVDIPSSFQPSAKANEETSHHMPGQSSASRRFFPNYTFLFVLLLALSGAATAYYIFFFNKTKSIDSLAVLPFVNASVDSGTEYLSDGITESIINSLTQIPGLRVIPRSTVFRFKGKDIDPQEVGTKLKVRAVLTGRIVQRGDDINVQLDLIDVDGLSQIYGNQYHHKATDILSMQEEIIGDVLKPLGVTLSKETQKTVNKRYTENVEAYKLYLQGRFYWNKRKASEILKAITFFNQAIALDATYALAYVGLADCYAILEQYAGLPGKETYPKAVSSAARALELDNTLAEAHTTIAFANAAMWNWEKSEKEFKNSLSLNPNYATTYHWYSILLHALGRHDEAFRLIKRAQEIDPLSPVIAINVAIAYDFDGNHEKCLEGMDAVLAIDSTFGPAYYRKVAPYLKLGKKQEAYRAASKGVEISGRSSEALSFFGYSSAVVGKRDEALRILKELEQRYASQTSSGYYIARVYAGLGDRNGIFKWLKADLENHSGSMIWLTQDDEWDAYRSDLRFLELLHKIGIQK